MINSTVQLLGSFLLGFVSGFILRGILDKNKEMLRSLILILFTLVFSYRLIVQASNPGLSIPYMEYILMGLVIGTFTEVKNIKKLFNDKNSKKPN